MDHHSHFNERGLVGGIAGWVLGAIGVTGDIGVPDGARAGGLDNVGSGVVIVGGTWFVYSICKNGDGLVPVSCVSKSVHEHGFLFPKYSTAPSVCQPKRTIGLFRRSYSISALQLQPQEVFLRSGAHLRSGWPIPRWK